MAEPVVAVEGLTKRYGAARGIEDVAFDVRPGEVFGFLGPNGAGKTTTIRLLLDLLRPTSGSARVFGLDPRKDAVAIHRRVGYLPGEAGLAERLTAREQLEHLGHLRGGVPAPKIEALARRFGLELDRPVRALSLGNKRKVGLVQAFMHDPELLVLDEPTAGLDPLMQQEFNRLVRERKAAGATLFLSSHILSEVELLCDRVAIIREGRIVAVEDMAAVKARAVRTARVRLRGPADARALAGVEGVGDAKADGVHLTCTVRGPTGPLVRALAALDVEDLSIREPTLEDVFLGYYGGGAQ